ncbi:hypothetical protein [uncultured Selenomonas sp.]|uniref:hypothetical protein n=1 Tax=uncultured Selenomonas sp. TaxID=159275 RepID=UPI0028E7E9F8|nr:hypothetical protein [uncultured Selenomonas sp.]
MTDTETKILAELYRCHKQGHPHPFVVFNDVAGNNADARKAIESLEDQGCIVVHGYAIGSAICQLTEAGLILCDETTF